MTASNRFNPGDRIVFKGCSPIVDGVAPLVLPYDGQIMTVEKVYIPDGFHEAYYLITEKGDRVCYYTYLCELVLLDIPGDNDEDCI